LRTEPDPTVQWRLGQLLRTARATSGLTQREVAKSLDWHPSKVRRIENGDVSVSTTDLTMLLDRYGIRGEEETQPLLLMAQSVRDQAYRLSRGVAASAFARYLDRESHAFRLRSFEPIIVPGLLQTGEYAREVIRAFSGMSSEDVERGVQTRMERQKAFLRRSELRSYFVLDEAAIRRWVGGHEVMRSQLVRLRELCALPNVSIRILPFEQSIHSAHRGAFVLLGLRPELEGDELLYRESPIDSDATEDEALLHRYSGDFAELQRHAATESESRDALDQAIEHLDRKAPTTAE
jgi:transcriptional regulator with XRE-family HTH domain